MGTRGLGDLEDTSQKMEDVWKVTETTEREGLDNIDRTDENSACKAGSVEKLTLEAERLMETAEEEAGTWLKGQDKASATMFSEPGTWTILLVNSGM